MHSALDNCLNNATGHGFWIGDDDTPKSNIYHFLALFVSRIDKSHKVSRRGPLLGTHVCVIKEPISFFKVIRISDEGRDTNQLPVTLIHSGQSNGGGTTMGLKLYKKGILWGSILSKLVLARCSTLRLKRLIWPEVARQNT
jgi:hypothetical protein